MALSKANERLLVELVKNQENIEACLTELYKNKSPNEATKINSRFGALRDEGFLNVQFGDDRAYIVILTAKADDYVEESGLLREELTYEILNDIVKKC